MNNWARFTAYGVLTAFVVAAIIIGGIRDIWWMVALWIVLLVGYEIILKLTK